MQVLKKSPRRDILLLARCCGADGRRRRRAALQRHLLPPLPANGPTSPAGSFGRPAAARAARKRLPARGAPGDGPSAQRFIAQANRGRVDRLPPLHGPPAPGAAVRAEREQLRHRCAMHSPLRHPRCASLLPPFKQSTRTQHTRTRACTHARTCIRTTHPQTHQHALRSSCSPSFHSGCPPFSPPPPLPAPAGFSQAERVNSYYYDEYYPVGQVGHMQHWWWRATAASGCCCKMRFAWRAALLWHAEHAWRRPQLMMCSTCSMHVQASK